MKKGCLIAVIIVVVLFILGAIGPGVAGYFVVKSPEFQKGFNSGFTQSFKKSFVESCSKSDPQKLEPVCTCMADYMTTKYSPSQLTQLGLKTQDEIKNSEIMTSAAESCRQVIQTTPQAQ